MRTGGIVGRFLIGPQIGQGAFGKIFAARDSESGRLYAIKNESSRAERKTLAFETKVLRRIQESPYVPRLFDSGETNSLMWAAIELVGPSLSSILKRAPAHALTLASAVRAARHALLALESLHGLGFVHRDVKPGNILVRAFPQPAQPPLCLIDFGLARIYRDQRTRAHERPRPRTGFRGTKTYASLNAHAYTDLSRRDDLASWFYVVVDALTGGLPWRGVTNNIDVAVMKSQFDMRRAVQRFAPALYDIWLHITQLRFESDPDYAFMLAKLDEVMHAANVRPGDPYDWDDFMGEYKRTLASGFGFAGSEPSYYAELGLPPALVQQVGRKEALAPRAPQSARSFSVMQQSELNEGARDGCCC